MTRARGPDATQPMPKAIVSADLRERNNEYRQSAQYFKKKDCSAAPPASGQQQQQLYQADPLPTFRRGADLQGDLNDQG
jgi:hypothetical protein